MMSQTNYFSMFRLRLTLLCFTLGIVAPLLKDFFFLVSNFALIMKLIALKSRKKKEMLLNSCNMKIIKPSPTASKPATKPLIIKMCVKICCSYHM